MVATCWLLVASKSLNVIHNVSVVFILITQFNTWVLCATHYVCMCAQLPSCVQLFVTPWTVAHQAPLFMGFPSNPILEWFAFPTPGDLPDSGIKPAPPACPALAGRFFTPEPPGKPYTLCITPNNPSNTHEVLLL